MVSPFVCTESGKGCFFAFFQKPIVAGQPPAVEHISTTVVEVVPLKVMSNGLKPGSGGSEGSEAVPVRVKGALSGEPGQVPLVQTVCVNIVGVKFIIPVTGIDGPATGVSEKS